MSSIASHLSSSFVPSIPSASSRVLHVPSDGRGSHCRTCGCRGHGFASHEGWEWIVVWLGRIPNPSLRVLSRRTNENTNDGSPHSPSHPRTKDDPRSEDVDEIRRTEGHASFFSHLHGRDTPHDQIVCLTRLGRQGETVATSFFPP